MKVAGNTILITGGATGIGLELARALLRRGNDVIICGRRRERLEEARAANPALHVRVADVANERARRELAAWTAREFPRLNILVNNAGIQHRVDLAGGDAEMAKVDEEIAINLAAPIHLTSLFLPQLKHHDEAAVVNISSGLGFAPLAHLPIYCATKAALHSLTMSLRHQLRGTSVRVFEMIPPTVTSELGAGHRPPEVKRAAMPAAVCAAQIVEALENDVYELAIGDAANLREKRDAMFPIMNR